jgi:hypothetical protein
MPRARRRQRGGANFDRLKSFAANVINSPKTKELLQKTHKFVKDNQLLSKGISLINHKHAGTAAAITNLAGYGQMGGAAGISRKVRFN